MPADETVGASSPPGEEAAEPSTGADEAAAVVEEDLERLLAERDELRGMAQRLQADFENYRKRMQREQTERIERANEGLVEQLLPVLDSFELALGSLDDADERVRKGVELVYSSLVGVLEKQGLARIATDGATFDPNRHEAVLQEETGEHDEPVVVEALRTGYEYQGRVLRPAMVKVAR